MKRSIETSDIVLAATLKLSGYELERIAKERNRGIFCFNGVDEAVLVNYDLGKSLVEPVAFNNTIKSLTTAARRII